MNKTKSINQLNKETEEYIIAMTPEQYQLLINRTWTDLLNSASENDKDKYTNIENTLNNIGTVATNEQKRNLDMNKINSITFNNLMKSYYDSINKTTLLEYTYIFTLFVSDVDTVLTMLNIYNDVSKAKRNRINENIKLKSYTLELSYKSLKENHFIMELAKKYLDPLLYNYIKDTISTYENLIKNDSTYKKLVKEGLKL